MSKDPVELVRNRKELVEEMQDENGYIYCQNCHKSRAFKFEVHHIIFRSERPKHPFLHNKKNLIILCSSCHEFFHKVKSWRENLVKERGLDEIFNI